MLSHDTSKVVTIANTSISKLETKQLQILRATINGAPAGDEEMFDKVIEQLSTELGVDEDVAQKRLSAYINQRLESENAEIQKRWTENLNNTENGAAIVYADGDPSDFTR